MIIFSCIFDGGLLCIGLPLLLASLFPWITRRFYKLCKKSCKCSCHSNKPVDDGDRPGFAGIDKYGNSSSGLYPYYKDEHTMEESPVAGCHCRMCESARAAKQ